MKGAKRTSNGKFACIGERPKTKTERSARVAAYQRANPEKMRAWRKAWEARNPEKVRVSRRARRVAKLDHYLAYERLSYARNADRAKASNRAWWLRNKARGAALIARRRAQLLQRTPAWSDFEAIAAIYAARERLTVATGIPHEVDHEIPLLGRRVSGLHVHENLRVIPALANRQKHNRFEVQ